jgi:putative flippase GtrA
VLGDALLRDDRLADDGATFSSAIEPPLVVDVDGPLPLRSETVALIRSAQAEGRRVFLASVAHRRDVEMLATSLGDIAGVFAASDDERFSDADKAIALEAAFGRGGFDYLADHPASVAAWPTAGNAMAALPGPTRDRFAGHGYGTAFRYAAFAVVSSSANFATQQAVLMIYSGWNALAASILSGTAAGFFIKYALDKFFIFDDGHNRRPAQEVRKIGLYGMTAVLTTIVFWSMELGFLAIGGAAWKYVGGGLGLCVGYATKYFLDRRVVFRET